MIPFTMRGNIVAHGFFLLIRTEKTVGKGCFRRKGWMEEGELEGR